MPTFASDCRSRVAASSGGFWTGTCRVQDSSQRQCPRDQKVVFVPGPGHGAVVWRVFQSCLCGDHDRQKVGRRRQGDDHRVAQRLSRRDMDTQNALIHFQGGDLRELLVGEVVPLPAEAVRPVGEQTAVADDIALDLLDA